MYITKHALERYAERFGGSNSISSVQKRTNRMTKVAAFGVEIKPKDEAMIMLRNKFKKVRYVLYRNIVVVHDVESDRILTVYDYDRDKYYPLKRIAAGVKP